MLQAAPLDTAPCEKETEVVRNPNALSPCAVNQIPCLVQIYPADAGIGRRFLLDRPHTLGRETGCDVRLDDASLSRQHARIVPQTDGCYVADVRSTNGTFVNNARVRILQKLNDGDYIRLGSHIFRYLAGGNIEADYHEEIFRLTITDALTGAFNKRHLLDFMERELSRSLRHQRPLAVILLDIDHFKAVNDTYGHLAGDAVLRELAHRLSADIRREECLARYGGEEFALVLPETSRAGAGQLAERLRGLVADAPFTFDHDTLALTISLGVYATDGGEHLTALEILGRADRHLYQAKHEGRNRVVC